MGIHYHHDEPLSLLKLLYQALKPGGTLIFEGIGIDGDGPHAFFPEGPYARMKGCSFLPTRDCALAWLRRTRFRHAELVDWTRCTAEEQRSTGWMPFTSFRDAMAPDFSTTIEGHPAPHRFVIKALR
jgi:tRNA (mo5U34)-methyltransferase